MSLPPVNATTVALNNSAPGTTELFGKMLLGVGIGGAVICLGAVIYSKMSGSSTPEPTPSKGGSRYTLRMHRNHRNRTRRS
jgi:hypothetical protein